MLNKSIRIILGSRSPRRKEILGRFFHNVVISPQDTEEQSLETEPDRIVMDIALKKLGLLPSLFPNDLVITADTIVWYNDKIYGKPVNDKDAERMLKELSGNTHKVFTGFAIAFKGKIMTDYDVSEVKFRNLSEREIIDYIHSGSPMDKAGAYGIQDNFAVMSYEGDIDTIVGLPLRKILIQCEEFISNEEN